VLEATGLRSFDVFFRSPGAWQLGNEDLFVLASSDARQRLLVRQDTD